MLPAQATKLLRFLKPRVADCAWIIDQSLGLNVLYERNGFFAVFSGLTCGRDCALRYPGDAPHMPWCVPDVDRVSIWDYCTYIVYFFVSDYGSGA